MSDGDLLSHVLRKSCQREKNHHLDSTQNDLVAHKNAFLYDSRLQRQKCKAGQVAWRERDVMQMLSTAV